MQHYNSIATLKSAVAVETVTPEMLECVCHPDVSNYKGCTREASLT
jgi:hypothetical protein